MVKKPDVADWFYLPAWTVRTLPRTSSKSSDVGAGGVSWLVFADKGGFGSRLAERLEGDVTTVVPGEGFSNWVTVFTHSTLANGLIMTPY